VLPPVEVVVVPLDVANCEGVEVGVYLRTRKIVSK
jgi:hypothetical protein